MTPRVDQNVRCATAGHSRRVYIYSVFKRRQRRNYLIIIIVITPLSRVFTANFFPKTDNLECRKNDLRKHFFFFFKQQNRTVTSRSIVRKRSLFRGHSVVTRIRYPFKGAFVQNVNDSALSLVINDIDLWKMSCFANDEVSNNDPRAVALTILIVKCFFLSNGSRRCALFCAWISVVFL